MTDYARAMRDPKSCFAEPSNVLSDQSLTKDQKINILKQWEYDAREQSVAEEENMPTGPSDTFMISRIREALRELGVSEDSIRGSKQ